jgi:hypothetical protein
VSVDATRDRLERGGPGAGGRQRVGSVGQGECGFLRNDRVYGLARMNAVPEQEVVGTTARERWNVRRDAGRCHVGQPEGRRVRDDVVEEPIGIEPVDTDAWQRGELRHDTIETGVEPLSQGGSQLRRAWIETIKRANGRCQRDVRSPPD